MAEQGGARLAWPDAAKGLGVLLVGLGHSRLLPEWASAWIYSFHMPLFFLLSGWFFSLRPGGVGATLRHKALPILMPYLAYNLAFFCWESAAAIAAGGGPDWDGLLGIALQWPDTPWAGRAWFFPGLFAAECLFALLLRALEGRENRLLPAALLAAGAVWIYARLGGARLPWHVDAAVLLLPYLALGRRARHWLERHPASVCSAGQTIRLALVCLGANLLFTAFNRNLGPTRIDYNLRYLNEFFTCYAAGACGAAFCVLLCRALPAARGLRFLGKYSAAYYAVGWLGSNLAQRAVECLAPVSGWGLLAVHLAGLVLIPAPLILLLDRFCPILLGRRRPHRAPAVRR